jgi:hypothetical protein
MKQNRFGWIPALCAVFALLFAACADNIIDQAVEEGSVA